MCVCVCATCLVPSRAGRSFQMPLCYCVRVTWSCELESNSGPLEEQHMLLTARPISTAPNLFYLCIHPFDHTLIVSLQTWLPWNLPCSPNQLQIHSNPPSSTDFVLGKQAWVALPSWGLNILTGPEVWLKWFLGAGYERQQWTMIASVLINLKSFTNSRKSKGNHLVMEFQPSR